MSDILREDGINHEFQKLEREFGDEYQIVFFQIEFEMGWNIPTRTFHFLQVLLEMISNHTSWYVLGYYVGSHFQSDNKL